jgi:hypothetical protein
MYNIIIIIYNLYKNQSATIMDENETLIIRKGVRQDQKEERIRRINIQTDNKLLEQVKHYKYLGNIINQDGRCIIEKGSRIVQIKSVLMKKKKLLCSNNMNIKMRKRFIKVYVRSVALYGCETWILNMTEQRTIKSFEIWCWIRMLRVNWIEHRIIENIFNEIVQRREILKPSEQDDRT